MSTVILISGANRCIARFRGVQEMTRLVHLNVPLLLGLQSLEPLVVVDSLLVTDFLQHVLDSRHHTLESTEVDVGATVELAEDLISILFNLILDVHLSTLLVLLFTAQGIVQTELVRVRLLDSLELVVVQEGITVSNTEEQPSLSLVRLGGGGFFNKETADETTVGGNTGTGGNHDVVSVGVLLRHQHNLSGRSSHLNFITRLGVTEEVRADTLLGRIFGLKFRAPVGGATDAKTSSLSSHVITITAGSNRVKTDRVGLSVLFTDTRGDDTPRLALPVREVTIVIDDDVASLSGSLGSNNTLGGDNLSGERGLVLVDIDRNSGLIIVRRSLQEILLSVQSGAVERDETKG